MNFLNDIKNSSYNAAFYGSLKERKLASSFGYFFLLVASLSFIVAFVIGVETAPKFSSENLRKLAEIYPRELEMQIKGGTVSTNVSEPYLIKNSSNYLPPNSGANYANWVVIDTKNDFSADAFKRYDTFMFVGKNFIVTSKNRDQFEFTDVSRAPNFILNQSRILHWIDLVVSYHWLISLGLLVFMFCAFFIFFILKLPYLLFMAVFVWLAAKFKKVPLSYKNSYQVSLHAITVPLILETVFMAAGVRQPFIFFYSLVLLVIAFLNVKKSENVLPPVSLS